MGCDCHIWGGTSCDKAGEEAFAVRFSPSLWFVILVIGNYCRDGVDGGQVVGLVYLGLCAWAVKLLSLSEQGSSDPAELHECPVSVSKLIPELGQKYTQQKMEPSSLSTKFSALNVFPMLGGLHSPLSFPQMNQFSYTDSLWPSCTHAGSHLLSALELAPCELSPQAEGLD